MTVSAVSTLVRVSGGCDSLYSLMVSDELSIIIKSAGFRRFLLVLALLVLFLPSPPAQAERTCDIFAGEFPDPFNPGDCYECSDGYAHNPLLPVGIPGVCSKKTNLRVADPEQPASFLCPQGTFFSFINGQCNTCPEGFTSDGGSRCIKREEKIGNDAGPFRFSCPSGTFPVGGSCYTCPAGYNKDIGNTCSRTTTSLTKGVSCGSRSFVCDTFFIFCLAGHYNYSGGAPSCGNLEGNTYYNCPSGYATNVFPSYTENNKCIRVSTSVVGITFNSSLGCDPGEFDGGNSRCYTCDPGFGPLPLQLPGTPGVCSSVQNVAMTPTGGTQFLCPTGQFLDLGSNRCYSCPTGYLHDTVPTVNTPGVCYQLDNQLATFVPGKKSTESCVGVGQGTCEDGLLCDFLGECRHPVPEKGEICGVLEPCAETPEDIAYNPLDSATWDQANGSLTCVSGRCVTKRGPRQACDSLVANSCADDLLCVSGECQHARPLEGERCDPVFSPCAIEEPHSPPIFTTDIFGIPVNVKPPLNLVCHTDNYFDISAARCTTPRKTGEICSGLGQGSCEPDHLCTLSYNLQNQTGISIDNFDAANIGFRCVPRLDSIFGNTGAADCRKFYDKAVAENVNQGRAALVFGYATSIGAGVTGAIETGIVYGPPVDKDGNPLKNPGGTIRDVNGEFACYQKTCVGLNFAAGVSDAACFGIEEKFPDDGEHTIEVFGEIDLADALSGGTSPIEVSIAISAADEVGSDPLPDGGGACLSVGVGVGPPGVFVNAGAEDCTTAVLKVNIDDFWGPNAPGEGSQNTLPVTNTTCVETIDMRTKSGKLQLTWAPIAGAVSYQILRNSAGSDSPYTTIVTDHFTTYATYLDEGLTNGTTYWYRIAAKDDQGTGLCTTEVANGTPVARIRRR